MKYRISTYGNTQLSAREVDAISKAIDAVLRAVGKDRTKLVIMRNVAEDIFA